MVKKSLSKVLGGLKQPDFPMNTFEVFMNSRFLELTVVKREHEKRWGINRLIELVDSEFRIKVWRQAERVFEASVSRDEVKLDRAVAGMIKAYAALESWAVENGVPEMPAIVAVEHEMQDGSVMVVVGNHHDATLYQQFRPDVQSSHLDDGRAGVDHGLASHQGDHEDQGVDALCCDGQTGQGREGVSTWRCDGV